MLVLLSLLTICFSSQATVIKQDHVEVRLIRANAADEKPLRLGVHFKIDPDWHVYWKNPGDSGAAPKFELSGGSIAAVHWPYPERIPIKHLTNFGYSNDVAFPIDVVPDQGEMTLRLEWLVCKVDCIPGFGEFQFSAASVEPKPELYQKYFSRIPQPSEQWRADYLNRNDSHFNFTLDGPELSEVKNIFIFPEDGAEFQSASPLVALSDGKLNISVPLSENAKRENGPAAFTFVAHKANGETEAFIKNIEPIAGAKSWLVGLLFALVGGLILNLMPCVFPVLFLKAYGILKEPDTKKIKRSSWAYFFGVVISFIVFGAILIALRLSGQALGWGFQLQNPAIVLALAILFFILALNFLGIFEIGGNLQNLAGRLGQNKFLSGSFGTGVLAVIVATPCTAPFMGSALGLTLFLPIQHTLGIFTLMGVGMALPMLGLAYFPRLGRWLPRSGPWMVRLKQLFAIPLMATSIWLTWIFVVQTGYAPQASQSSSNWTAFDEAAIEERRKTQHVFVDFTASWCITCQVNKVAVLDTDSIQDFFKQHKVYLVRADWTNHDPKITQALAKFGRNSIPLYVFYNNMGEVQILSEILTKEMILNLIKP